MEGSVLSLGVQWLVDIAEPFSGKVVFWVGGCRVRICSDVWPEPKTKKLAAS